MSLLRENVVALVGVGLGRERLAPLKRKTIEHIHRWEGRLYLFKNVQAEVCSQCGESFLKPAVLRLMDRCTATGKVRRARLSIPVISLLAKVSA